MSSRPCSGGVKANVVHHERNVNGVEASAGHTNATTSEEETSMGTQHMQQQPAAPLAISLRLRGGARGGREDEVITSSSDGEQTESQTESFEKVQWSDDASDVEAGGQHRSDGEDAEDDDESQSGDGPQRPSSESGETSSEDEDESEDREDREVMGASSTLGSRRMGAGGDPSPAGSFESPRMKVS